MVDASPSPRHFLVLVATWAAVALSLTLMFRGSLLEHVTKSETVFNDDACQQITPYLRKLGPGPRDYPERYCRAFLPIGYRGVYALAAGFDKARTLSRFAPYLLLAVFVIAMSANGHYFAGAAGAWAGAALALSADAFLERMVGGLPRGFGFPLFACTAWAVLHKRVVALGLITCLAAAFYPPLAVCPGLAMALLVLVPVRYGGAAEEGNRVKGVVRVGCAALLTGLLVLPPMLALKPYGPRIVPSMVADYPEAGPGGRFTNLDQVDFGRDVGACVRTFAPKAFQSKGAPWLPTLRRTAKPILSSYPAKALGAVLALLGTGWLVRRRVAGKRLALLTLAALGAYLAARQVAPYLYLPQRHVTYPLPVLILLWFIASASALPAALAALVRPWKAALTRPLARSVSVILFSAIALVTTGGRVDPDNGLTMYIADDYAPYRFVDSLPENAYIASWPNWASAVPYLLARPVLISSEYHLTLHAGYTLEMRRRMRLLIDAYFATDPGPLLRLRDEEGVTHLVVNRLYLDHEPPPYFKPFTEQIRARYATMQIAGSEVLRQRASAEVFSSDPVFVLDLSRIQPTNSAAQNEDRVDAKP